METHIKCDRRGEIDMLKALTDFRNSKKMSIQTMAKEIGVSKSYYEKIEYGDRQPSYNFITKFLGRFPDADTDKIFFGTESHEMCENKNILL